MNPKESSLPSQVDFVPFINYESIVCASFSDTPEKMNAACMGVHFTPSNDVYLHVYDDTHTRMLLKTGKQFSINFSENFDEYVIAGLKEYGLEDRKDELPRELFREISPVPILKSSWVTVICEVIEMPDEYIQKPPCRRRQDPNVRAKILKQNVYSLPRIFNNRSMNLALEALILVTRIPECEKYSDDYLHKVSMYVNLKQKLIAWRDMERFEESFQRMDNYLIDQGVKPQEIFDF